MARALTAATLAWTVAVASAMAGVLLPANYQHISFALFAFAVAVALLVAVVLVADGLRHRRARRRVAAEFAQAALERLEYVPPVTTRSRRIHWRGGRARVKPASADPTPLEAAPLGGLWPTAGLTPAAADEDALSNRADVTLAGRPAATPERWAGAAHGEHLNGNGLPVLQLPDEGEGRPLAQVIRSWFDR